MRRVLSKPCGGWPAGTVFTDDATEWRRWKAACAEDTRTGVTGLTIPNPPGYPVYASADRIEQLSREGYFE